MKKIIVKCLTFYFILFFTNTVFGQTNTQTLINSRMTLELEKDTLVSNTGLKFFAGQKLIIGNASGVDGYYRSIINKNAAIVPSIWGQDMRFENAIENHINKKKSREKVKAALLPGNIVTIKKIGFSKSGKPYFYMASLNNDKDIFYCDLKLALVLKELLLQP